MTDESLATNQITRIEQHGERGLFEWGGQDWRRWSNEMHGAMTDFRDIMETAWQAAAKVEEEG